MKRIRFHPDARRELFSSIRRYNQQQRSLGGRFRQAVDSALEHIQEFPQTGILSAGKTRTLSVRSFPYGVVFKLYDEEFRIYAVYHLHRDEDYWVHRLQDSEQDNNQ